MKLERYGYTVFFVSLVLSLLGVVFIFTSSYFYCQLNGMKPYSFALKQGIALILSVAVCLSIYRFFDYRRLADLRFTWGSYAFSILILIFVLLFGREVHGSKNWIFIGGFSVQPSEIAKFFVIVFMASYLKRRWYYIQSRLNVYAFFMFLTFLPIMLILLEKDLGSAVILSIVIFAVLFVTDIKLKYIIYPIAAGTVLFSLAIVTAPYRVARIKMLLHPLAYYHTAGKYSSYQLVQSLISFSKGGILGAGLGQGEQKMFFLPFPFSDFIYAHIGEEAGFIGALLILLAYVLILYCGLMIADRTDEKLGKYLSLGLSLYIFLQAMVHIGVNIGLVPTTGITLPFISLGGSSLLSTFMAVGLIMNISRLVPEKSKIHYEPIEKGRYA